MPVSVPPGGLHVSGNSSSLVLNAPPPKWVFPWLALDDLMPAGATPLETAWYRPPHLIATPRALFPSDAECTSPNGELTLFHLAESSGNGMAYTVFLRHKNDDRRRAIFQIRKAMEVLWSPDSSQAAITVLTGDNSATVVLLRMDDLKPIAPLPIENALQGHLSPYLINAPQFVMARQWTTTGELLLRARGQEPLEPYALFGYELLVDPNPPTVPGSIRFLRGYINAPNPNWKL